MKTTTEYRCPECSSAFCTESFDNGWLECPRCSRISHDFKPPDFHHSGDWDFPDVDGVELAISLHSTSLSEHAYEH
jgi:DNA-directed RNA polymerase subunit RPC12/RpoP